MPDLLDKQSTMQHHRDHTRLQLEKYSSAVSLSDMEIFVFPELLYSLVLANILSPRIWKWLEDPWFDKIDSMNPHRKIQRLKQYIIDHYEFNLDLDTWGLTTQEDELARFNEFIDTEILSESNALFGYEGDKYYFDMDIRRHFGLDKYTSNIIPYWKTETLEAMDAFHLKEEYTVGAGECVSLSTLYAAALFIICKIPLEDIFLVATPLHSQNFVALNDGYITNNRRIVTKNMWFNGTELTAQAQRALQHERVTIVANNSGYIHTMYPEATIDLGEYKRFEEKLTNYLETDIDMEIVANFLRQCSNCQKCFQIRQNYHGQARYIPAEKVYAYEHGSPYKVNDSTREKLLSEIDEYEFFADPIPDRLIFNDFESFFKGKKIDLNNEEDMSQFLEAFSCQCSKAPDIGKELLEFAKTHPRLPHEDKTFVATKKLAITPEMTRQDIMTYLQSLREEHPVADLAFYAYRDMTSCDWAPFMQAAIERCPVCIASSKDLSDEAIIEKLSGFAPQSIYDEARLAQPDECWNFQSGDGVEIAICLATILKSRYPNEVIEINITEAEACLRHKGVSYAWPSNKGLRQELTV